MVLQLFSSRYCRFLPIVYVLRRCWKWFPSAPRCSSHLKNTFIACKKFCGWNWRHITLTVYFQIVFSLRIVTVPYPLTCPTSKKLIAWLQIWWMRPQSYGYYSVIKNTFWTTNRIFLHCHPNKRQTFSHNCTGVQKMVSECVQQTGVNCGLSKQNGSSNCICPYDIPDANLKII